MDSPSSGSPSPPTLSDRRDLAVEAPPRRPAAQASRDDVVLVAGLGDGVAADFAAFVGQEARSQAILVGDERVRDLAGGRIPVLSPDEWLRSTPDDRGGREPTASLILFLAPRLTELERRALADLLTAAGRWPIGFVGVISSFRVHLDDPAAEEVGAVARFHWSGPAASSPVSPSSAPVSSSARIPARLGG